MMRRFPAPENESTQPAAGGGASPPAPPPASAPAWYEGADPAFVGSLQKRNLADKTPAEAAQAFYKAHAEAEKFIGAPANEVVRLPKAEDTEGWRGVYNRLGRPVDPKGYDFSDIKFSDGSALDQKFAEFVADKAHANNLTATQARGFVKELTEFMDARTTAASTEMQTALAAQKEALQKNWGANWDMNLLVAKKGAEKLGMTPETVAAFEQVLGYDKVMETFRKVGELSGEARFISGGSNPGVFTREQALAEIESLKRDREFGKKLLNGDHEANQRFRSLHKVAFGDETERR